jgi:hypothetical protein
MVTDEFEQYLNSIFTESTVSKCENKFDEIDFKIVSLSTRRSSQSSINSFGSSSISLSNTRRTSQSDIISSDLNASHNGRQQVQLHGSHNDAHGTHKNQDDLNRQGIGKLKEEKNILEIELVEKKELIKRLELQNKALKDKPQPVKSSFSSSSSASFTSRPVENTEQIDELKKVIASLQEQKKTLLRLDENKQAIFVKLKEYQEMKRKEYEKDPRMFEIISQIERTLQTGLIDGNIRKKLTTYIEEQITSNESDVGEKLIFYEKYQENEDILRNLYQVSDQQMITFRKNSDLGNKLQNMKDLLELKFTENVKETVIVEYKKDKVEKEKTFNLLNYIKKYIRKEVEKIFSLSFTDTQKLKLTRDNYIANFKKIIFADKLQENFTVHGEKERLVGCLNKVRDFILLENAMEYEFQIPNSVLKTGFYDIETKANYFQVLYDIQKKPEDMEVVKNNYFFNIYLDPEGILKESKIILQEGLNWTRKNFSGFNLDLRLKKHIEALRDDPQKSWFKEESEFFTITEQATTTSSSNTGSNEIIIKVNGYIDKIIDIVNQDLPTKLNKIQEIVNTKKSEEEKTKEIFSELDLDMEGKDHDMNQVNKNFLHLLKSALQGQEFRLKSDVYTQLTEDCIEAFVSLDYNLRVNFLETSRNDFIRKKKQNLGMKSNLEFAYMGIKFLKSEIRNPDTIPEQTKKKMTAAELDRERELFRDLQKFQGNPDQKYSQWERKQQESQRNRRGGRGGFPGGRGGGFPGGGRGGFPGGGLGGLLGDINKGTKLRKVTRQGEGEAGGNQNAVSTSSTTSNPGPLSFLDEIKSKWK